MNRAGKEKAILTKDREKIIWCYESIDIRPEDKGLEILILDSED